MLNNNYTYGIITDLYFENKTQLHQLEGHYIKEYDCVNKYIPGRTKKQHY
jgi:hypothetical protein